MKIIKFITLFILDIPIHSITFLSFAGSTAGHTIRFGNRHVVAGLYFGGNAYGRASVFGFERN